MRANVTYKGMGRFRLTVPGHALGPQEDTVLVPTGEYLMRSWPGGKIIATLTTLAYDTLRGLALDEQAEIIVDVGGGSVFTPVVTDATPIL